MDSQLGGADLNVDNADQLSKSKQFNIQKKRDGSIVKNSSKFKEGQWMLFCVRSSKLMPLASFDWANITTGERKTISFSGKEKKVISLLTLLEMRTWQRKEPMQRLWRLLNLST